MPDQSGRSLHRTAVTVRALFQWKHKDQRRLHAGTFSFCFWSLIEIQQPKHVVSAAHLFLEQCHYTGNSDYKSKQFLKMWRNNLSETPSNQQMIWNVLYRVALMWWQQVLQQILTAFKENSADLSSPTPSWQNHVKTCCLKLPTMPQLSVRVVVVAANVASSLRGAAPEVRYDLFFLIPGHFFNVQTDPDWSDIIWGHLSDFIQPPSGETKVFSTQHALHIAVVLSPGPVNRLWCVKTVGFPFNVWLREAPSHFYKWLLLLNDVIQSLIEERASESTWWYLDAGRFLWCWQFV